MDGNPFVFNLNQKIERISVERLYRNVAYINRIVRVHSPSDGFPYIIPRSRKGQTPLHQMEAAEKMSPPAF